MSITGEHSCVLSHVWLFVTGWAVAHQTSLSMGLSRQEYWSTSPFPSPAGLPDPGIQPRSPILQADSLPSDLPQKPMDWKVKPKRAAFFFLLDSVQMPENPTCILGFQVLCLKQIHHLFADSLILYSPHFLYPQAWNLQPSSSEPCRPAVLFQHPNMPF